MKRIKFILSILLIIYIYSCSNSTGPEYDNELVGSWKLTDIYSYSIFYTNTNQTAINPHDYEGEIIIEGEYNFSFQGFLEQYFQGDTSFWLYTWDATEIIGDLEIWKNETLELKISVVGTESNTEIFSGEINYTFDGLTLVMSPSIMTNSENGTSVTIYGAISYKSYYIPANEPTEIYRGYWNIDRYPLIFKEETINLYSDGKASLTNIVNGVLDTKEGTWQTEDSEIIISSINKFENKQISYEIVNSTMQFNLVNDECVESTESEVACLESYEKVFQMNKGSLNKVESQNIYYFDKVDN